MLRSKHGKSDIASRQTSCSQSKHCADKRRVHSCPAVPGHGPRTMCPTSCRAIESITKLIGGGTNTARRSRPRKLEMASDSGLHVLPRSATDQFDHDPELRAAVRLALPSTAPTLCSARACAIGVLEPATPAFDARGRPLLDPKQFGLNQCLDQRFAVDGDNGPWRRRLSSWTCGATSSVPVPLSPSIYR